ncbi:transposase [Candidatus Erwinia dacicola]
MNKLRLERQGKTPAGLPLTPEQLELREARKKIQRLEMENKILKKATALLMSDALSCDLSARGKRPPGFL